MCFGILFGLIAPTLLVHGHFPSIYKVTAKDICMLQGLFYAVVASCSFGLIPLFTLPLMQESIASSTILFARFGISSMIMGVILVLCRQPLAICRGDMWRLSVLGFCLLYTSPMQHRLLHFFWHFTIWIAVSSLQCNTAIRSLSSSSCHVAFMKNYVRPPLSHLLCP